MAQYVQSKPKYVTGPNGTPLSIADLPDPGTRWVIRRKAEVIAAIRGGLLSLEDACDRYRLTIEEILAWQSHIERFGLAGLRTTCLQRYRHDTISGHTFEQSAEEVI